MKPGLCCISLELKDQGIGHQTMTFKRFASLPRSEALTVLGDRILNNLRTTNETIRYCGDNGWTYRVSSDIFPLITYDAANVSLEDLPNHEDIQDEFDRIEETIASSGVRVSCHPSEYTVLASPNEQAVEKSITELNFYSSFFDRIGLAADHSAPMNFHIHSVNGSKQEVVSRFMRNFDKLDDNCKARITIECDDKVNCWSVKDLITIFHPVSKIPICFDYLHHRCHSDGLDEKIAINLCYSTWGEHKPLFHYSESAPGNNPRKHADYATQPIETYGLDFDLDFEIKQKDFAIKKYQELYPLFEDCPLPTVVAN